MLSVVNKPFMLSVTMPNVVMLCVLAPLGSLHTHNMVAMFSKKMFKILPTWGKTLSEQVLVPCNDVTMFTSRCTQKRKQSG
jgi:hypothetical protein